LAGWKFGSGASEDLRRLQVFCYLCKVLVGSGTPYLEPDSEIRTAQAIRLAVSPVPMRAVATITL
jgi:hypothetical protein